MQKKFLVGFPMILIISVAFLGNILVCVAIRTDRSLRKTGNLFLASLAVADLFVSSFVMTFAAINDLGYWCFSLTLCDIWFAFDVMCSTSSILNLCAISLDRYVHIKDPLRYERLVTKKIAIVIILIIWFLSAMISFIPIHYGLHKSVDVQIQSTNQGNKTREYCIINLSPTFAVLSSCISFYVPCIIMIGIYCQLYIYARKHVRNIRAIAIPLTSETQSSNLKNVKKKKRLRSIQMNDIQNSSYHVSDHKAAITVGVIMGVFLVCWFPFFIVNVITPFCNDCISELVFKILTWFGYCNSAFNPIIYSIFNQEFREAFKKILFVRLKSLKHYNHSKNFVLRKCRNSQANCDKYYDDTKFEYISDDNNVMETELNLHTIITNDLVKNDEVSAV